MTAAKAKAKAKPKKPSTTEELKALKERMERIFMRFPAAAGIK